MYRTIFSIGIVLALLSIFGLLTPHNITFLTFLFPDGVNAVAGLLLALLLCNFAVVSYFRKTRPKLLFGVVGASLAIAGIAGIIEPTYFGLVYYATRPADLLVFLISGIGLMLAALEYNRPSFQIEVGIPYRQYLRFILARPTLLMHSFKKRAALVAAAVGSSAQQSLQ